MRTLRPVLLILGVLAALMGMVWIGQGLGFITWPASSFMLGRRVWVDYGAGLAIAGLLLILLSRRLRR